tara:strand:- start:1078 stop:1629 length:552 start_codon:yes stop_codon:yes gene_type:complete
MEKILITGTGRCGTTFLIKIFSFLNFNTGFNKDNYKNSIFSNGCNTGMERYYDDNYYILKNPEFMENIENIVKDKSIKIKNVIIPIRDLKLSAKSRVKYGNEVGGLWKAEDELSQIEFYKKILLNYILISTKYDINTIFLDFDKMISDKIYLYNKLKNILDEKNIDLETFSNIYDEATMCSKP